MKYQQTILSKELTLRPYNEETDKNIFYKMFKNDKDFAWFCPYKADKDFKHMWLEGRNTLFNSNGDFGFVIVRNIDNVVMGCIIFDSNYSTSHHVLKLSYYIGKEYRNNGYMQKALKILIDYGFKGKLYQRDDIHFKNRRYVINAFKAVVDLDNDASNRLLKKLGFVCSGIEYCAYSYDGRVSRDRYHYYLENPNHPPLR